MSIPEHELVEWLADERRRIEQAIREYGVFIQYVGGDPATRSTPFAYTVGLHGIGRPELLVLGVPPGTAGGLLNEVAARIRRGVDIAPGALLSFEAWPHRVTVEELPNPGRILFGANDFYGLPEESPVRAYQLTYDDKHGRFPWDDGYEVDAWLQPRPGEFRADAG